MKLDIKSIPETAKEYAERLHDKWKLMVANSHADDAVKATQLANAADMALMIESAFTSGAFEMAIRSQEVCANLLEEQPMLIFDTGNREIN